METESDNKGVAGQKEEGIKHDEGKLRWSLLPWNVIKDIVEVFEYGARKYRVGNWKLVPDAVERYKDATFRHLEAYMSGEVYDKESGLSHLAHAATNIIFLIWFSKTKRKRSTNG